MTKGHKQLTQEDRVFIEVALNKGQSVSEIAETLGRHTSTVSREIRKHIQTDRKNTAWKKNQCKKAQTCRLHNVCGRFGDCRYSCASCKVKNCNDYCGQFEPVECPDRLNRTAQVCNGCTRTRHCHFIKYFYICKAAHREYRRTLVESRSGADISAGELEYLNGIVTAGILRGQSMHHIFVANAGKFTRNERTVSRYLHDGMFDVKRGDMKRSCMVKQRKPKAKDYEHKVETACRTGRTYEDYEAYLASNLGARTVMMDLVIGRPGGKCLLTLHFPENAFMVARLVDSKCAENTAKVFDWLWDTLRPRMFCSLFPLILTDNGTEFSNPSRLETAPDGGPRTKIFYCDPMNSNQKSELERNHEFIRQVLPKGTSFDDLTQEKVDLMMSHINSYTRPGYGDKTPYKMFRYAFGRGVAELLGITGIDGEKVCLKPSLVGIRFQMLIETVNKK